MRKISIRLVILITGVLLIMNSQIVLAHEGIMAGDYELEIGWLTEPPITGQMNAIVVNVNKGDEPVEDVSGLEVSLTYGGQSKALLLEPFGENTPGQFVAPILPTVPGQYSVHLGGKLGDTDISADVEPEEVDSPTAVEFPIFDTNSQSNNFGITGWLALLGILFGLIGTGLGLTALRKK